MTSKNVNANRLSRKQAAAYIDKRPSTLDKWASKGINLKFHMEGGRAYYDIVDLDEYLKGQQTF